MASRYKLENPVKKRKWLSPDSNAFVSIDLEVELFLEEDGRTLRRRSVYGNMSIADCSRIVNLDVHGTTKCVKKFRDLAVYANMVADYIEENK